MIPFMAQQPFHISHFHILLNICIKQWAANSSNTKRAARYRPKSGRFRQPKPSIFVLVRPCSKVHLAKLDSKEIWRKGLRATDAGNACVCVWERLTIDCWLPHFVISLAIYSKLQWYHGVVLWNIRIFSLSTFRLK